jgi:hypothetical protein
MGMQLNFCALQQFTAFFLDAQCVHIDGIQLVLLFLNEFEYNLELDISIALIFLSVQMHIV